MATHALVFQVESIVAKYRRICAIFQVTKLDAAALNHFWWQVVHRLTHLCHLTVRAAVGDGAGCNRLFFKSNVSDGAMGMGTQNLLLHGRAWVRNLAAPGECAFRGRGGSVCSLV